VVMVLWPEVKHRGLLLTAGIAIPVVTGLFRIGLGVHWLSDVVAGWLFGLAVVAATTSAFLMRRRNREPVGSPR
jgi:membrane-associated phospholipid phosphatase